MVAALSDSSGVADGGSPGQGAGCTGSNADEHTRLLGDDTTRLTLRDELKALVCQLRLSASYVVFCMLMAVWCLVLVCYTVATHYQQHQKNPNPRWFVVSDAIIMAFIIFEVACDMIVAPCEEFWSSPWHLFDLFVCLFCLFVFGMDYYTDYGSATIAAHHHEVEIMSFPLFILRYMAQGFRIVSIMHNAKRAKLEADLVEETPIIMHRPSCSSEAKVSI